MIRKFFVTCLCFAGLTARAEDGCRARCLLVDTGPEATKLLSEWPRPNLKMLLVGDFEMVEGTTVGEMEQLCRTRTKSQVSKDRHSLLVAYATSYSFAGRTAIVDHVPLQSCETPD